MNAVKAASVLGLLAMSGCVTARATNAVVPKERASECVSVCQDLGMQLTAMVVIMSSAGCVCEPPKAVADKSPAGASGAAGGALISAALAAEQQAQQQQAQQQP